jgi:sugar phosphate isomerase/epimerase
MKLAISTLGCPNWTFQQVLENFHAYGVEGIEVRGIDGKMEADDITWFAPDKQAETKALLKQYGLKIIGFGSSFSFHDAAKVAQVIEKAKRPSTFWNGWRFPPCAFSATTFRIRRRKRRP